MAEIILQEKPIKISLRDDLRCNQCSDTNVVIIHIDSSAGEEPTWHTDLCCMCWTKITKGIAEVLRVWQSNQTSGL